MAKTKRGSSPRRRRDAAQGRRVSKSSCRLCKDQGGYIDYKDVALVRKFVSDRAKIRSSRVSGLCPQCQRKVSTAVKNAREMALLPYIPTYEGRPGVKR